MAGRLSVSFQAPATGASSGVRMKAKIIGVAVLALLLLSIVATGVGAVSQVGNLTPGSGDTGTALAQYNTPPEELDAGEESTLYSAFTFVCPFH